MRVEEKIASLEGQSDEHGNQIRPSGKRVFRYETSRFEALHASGLTALVGREEESELLAATLGKSKERRRPGGASLR
jgi:hypothetical protein